MNANYSRFTKLGIKGFDGASIGELRMLTTMSYQFRVSNVVWSTGEKESQRAKANVSPMPQKE